MFIYQTTLMDQYYDRVIDLRFNQNMSIRGITKILPLSKNTVVRWIANFAVDNPQAAVPYRMRSEKQQSTPPIRKGQLQDNNVQALQEEIRRLRSELLNAEIKAEAYDELINVAEAKFGIQIRKKAGAKQ